MKFCEFLLDNPATIPFSITAVVLAAGGVFYIEEQRELSTLNALPLSAKVEKLNAKEAYLNCAGFYPFPSLWEDTAMQVTLIAKLKNGKCRLELGQPYEPIPYPPKRSCDPFCSPS
jgi:hypothetical protein